ncbi:hypothetical protein ECC02_009706 [Trypanosoma cruzi]|uniref:Uncharacterized protein n=1 Tax=Trypanosoma cruzi TaxID=5693 RepID=A0A7J6XT55_TRYCR|nr:hypothetical protein ECC02_009706 [Trypanosoma cruzi]
MQKGTAALRCAHALPPVLLLLSPPALPLRHRHTPPRTAGGSPVDGSTAWEKLRHVQLPEGKQSALVPGTLNAHTTHLPACRHLHARNTSTRQIAVSRPPSSQKPPQPQSCASVRPQRSHPSTACPTQSVCVHVLVCLSAPIIAEQLCATRESKESNGRERQIEHTQITHIITHKHTHAGNKMGALNHNTSKPRKKRKTKTEAWDDQRTHSHCSRKAKHTHTGRERERGRPLNAIKTKQKQLRCSAHAARQDGSGACRAKESTNGPAWVCMQYIQWAHYVCASWGEVRARVHTRGHTQRVSEGRECVWAVHGSLSLTLTRPPPQPQPHTQQQEEEAKEGRWCGRPRCRRHCRQASSCYLFEQR